MKAKVAFKEDTTDQQELQRMRKIGGFLESNYQTPNKNEINNLLKIRQFKSTRVLKRFDT